MKNSIKRLFKNPNAETVQYRIGSAQPATHVFQVSVRITKSAPEGQIFMLPAWIPGSYMIREFARNIIQIRASANGKPVRIQKLDKHTWQADPIPINAPLTLDYEVYAWDLSVRAAHLDQTHAFFNASSVFLRVVGQESLSHVVHIERPAGVSKNWRVATALPELGAKRYDFGSYIASDYDELIDHPVEMGDFQLSSFRAHDIVHDVVITGHVPRFDMARLCSDLKRICETQIAFFEPKTKRAPMSRYVFLTMVVEEGFGGLEHRASTALICSRASLPLHSQATEITDEYQSLLGLCSHEYFHTWNVKRIKPAVFVPYNLQVENYTPLLWLFEGFTSYYDDLMLYRSGLIDEARYFKALEKTINTVLQNNSRTKQSVADSSFDAWIKYYRQDENAPNAVVSYYAKGSLVALALDLTIRRKTKGERSLDDLMLALWRGFGCDFYHPDVVQSGVTEEEVEALTDELCGVRMNTFFNNYVRGTEELPLAKLFAAFGVQLIDQRKTSQPSLDLALGAEGKDCTITCVRDGGAGQLAGLSAGDILLAVDGLRVSIKGGKNNLASLLAAYKTGDKVELHVFRRDELMHFTATLKSDATPAVRLNLKTGTHLPRPSC